MLENEEVEEPASHGEDAFTQHPAVCSYAGCWLWDKEDAADFQFYEGRH